MPIKRTKHFVNQFIALESSGGIILIFAALLALILANSPLADLYNAFLHIPVAIQLGSLVIDKDMHHWINDGLMAIFFFLIGLEIKREMMVGELSSFDRAILPVIAATGGVIAPAVIYFLFNAGDPEALRGWAVPVATDIAFAVGIISLLGSRVPVALKVVLLSLAIIDDLAAILIIAIFYTEEISFIALGLATLGFAICFLLNRLNVIKISPYILLGIVIWVCVLKSGIHATIAGVVLAFFIPLESKDKQSFPLRHLEHVLHPWVAFLIMPIFAFTNAGVSISGLPISLMFGGVPLGIMVGLFVGKQIGVFTFIYIAVKTKICRLPDLINWQQVYGLSLLCGIGFTMSLFISNLAFTDPLIKTEVTLAVLVGSTLSAVIGYLVLKTACPEKKNRKKEKENRIQETH